MTVGEVCAVIEELAPASLAYEWDRPGLSTGNPGARVSSLIVALTVTSESLKAAKKARAQMIVSHHPIIWDPLPSLRTDDPHARLCLQLAQAGIACYAAHTNLDMVPGGVNSVLAARLHLTHVKPLLSAPQARQVKLVTFVPESHLAAVRQAVCDAGAGMIGDYTYCSFSTPGVGTFMPGVEAQPFSGKKHVVNEETERRFETLVTKARLPGVLAALFKAHPYEEVAYDIVTLENTDPSVGLGIRGELDEPRTLRTFAIEVCKALRVSHVRMVGESGRRVRTAAVLGGSGGGEIARLPSDIDVFVTGDVKYDHALAARKRNVAVIDAGHAGTEKWIVPALAAFLKKRLPGVRVTTQTERDVFSLVTGE
ncbi:MAG: Nif3-like dinuclear metal center hexameric protein [Candidatus Hydrogenedentes bacterium]|nr:Nif3-like dinuclear metal center hexameric protein [Candidatus Hydrogenedentota bacterium]